MNLDDVDVLLLAAVEITFLKAAQDNPVFAAELAAFTALPMPAESGE